MNFTEQMLDMLTSAYDRDDIFRLKENKSPKTNIGKLLSVVGYGFDIIKEHTEKVRLWDDIDRAEGRSLDRYGGNYGVYRGETSDAVFRVMIKVKILSMLSAGQMDTIIRAASILFGVPATQIRAEEVFPAKLYLYINIEEIRDERLEVFWAIASLMRHIKAAGVGLRIILVVHYSREDQLHTGAMGSYYTRQVIVDFFQGQNGNSLTGHTAGKTGTAYARQVIADSGRVEADIRNHIMSGMAATTGWVQVITEG